MTGHERGLVRGQEQRTVRDLFGAAEPVHRVPAAHLLAHGLERLRLQQGRERRVDQTRAHAVDADPLRPVVDRHVLRHEHDAALRGVVGQRGAHALEPFHARDVHDAARALLDHRAQHVLRDQERSLQVDVDDAVPLVDRQLVREPAAADAGSVHEHIDAPVAVARGADRRLDERLVAHVEPLAEARFGRRRDHAVPRVVDGLLHVEPRDHGALVGEPARARSADPRRRPRDHGHAAGQAPRRMAFARLRLAARNLRLPH